MAFTTQDPKDTYLSILTLGDDGGGPPTANVLQPAALLPILDAAYTPSLIELSEAEVAFTGILSATVASGLVMRGGIGFEADDVSSDSLRYRADNAVGIIFTSGDPEGSLVASVGSLALRDDGSAGATLYAKESGVGNTGWTAFDVVTDFLGLSDTPAVYSAEKWVRVNAGGNALEFVDPPTVALGNFNDLADVPPLYATFGGYVVAVNLAETGLTFTNAAVGAFVDLSDTPGALVANKFLQVNGTGTALVLVDETSGTAQAFTDLTDGPGNFTDAAGALVSVNAAGDAVVYTGSEATWGDLLFFDGATWTALAAGTEGQVLTTHEATGNPSWEAVGGAFTSLTDAPAAYPADYKYSLLDVNAAEDGLEFSLYPLCELPMYAPFTPVGIMAYIDADQGGWIPILAPAPADDPAPRRWLSMQPSNDMNDTPGGPGIVGGYPEWYALEVYVGELFGNNIGGVDDYTLPYALNAGGAPVDTELSYQSLASMLADANFVGVAPNDGELLGYTTGGGVAWQAVGGNKYYDRVREPVTDGDTVTPEILFDSNGDVVMVEYTTEYTTHA